MFIGKFTYSLFVVLVVTGLFIIGCDKDDEMNKYPALGTYTAEATLNDSAEWTANGVLGIMPPDSDTITLLFDYYLNENCRIESISFNNIPLKLDTTELQHVKRGRVKYINQPTAHYSALDCDAIGEVYNLYDAEDFDNYLKINSIEQEESDGNITGIQGVFQMTLARDTTIPKIIFPDRPDTLKLTDGSFNAEIRQSE